MDNNNKKLLYNAVSQDYDLGDFDSFSKDLDDPAKRKKFFDAVSEDYDLGDYDSFNNQLGYSANSGAVVADTTGAPAMTMDQIEQAVGEADGGADTTATTEVYPNIPVHAPNREAYKRNLEAWKAKNSMSADDMWANAEDEELKERLNRFDNGYSGDSGAVATHTPLRVEDKDANLQSVRDIVNRNKAVNDIYSDVNKKMLEYGQRDMLGKDRAVQSGVEFNPETKQFQPKYVDSTGGETFNKEEAKAISRATEEIVRTQNVNDAMAYHFENDDELMSEIDKRIADIEAQGKEYTERRKAAKGQENSSLFERFISSAKDVDNRIRGTHMSPEVALSEDLNDPEFRNLITQKILLQQAKKRMEASKRKDEGFWGEFTEGGADALVNPETLGGSTFTPIIGSELAKVSRKWERGEKLTEDEQNLVIVAGLLNEAQSKDTALGYDIGDMLGQVLPFIAEVAMNPAQGSSKAITKGVFKGLMRRYGATAIGNKLATNIGKRLTTGALRAAGDIGQASALAGTLQAPKVIGGTGKRMAGTAEYSMGADGELKAKGFTEKEGALEALGKSFATMAIENYTELLGEQFGALAKGFKYLGGKVGKGVNKGVNKVLPKALTNVAKQTAKKGGEFMRDAAHLLRLDYINAFIKSQGLNKWINANEAFEKQIAFNGLAGEILEEEIAIPLNALLVGDEKIENLADYEHQMQILLGTALMTGGMAALRTPSFVNGKRKASKDYKKATLAAERAIGKEEWDTLRDRIDLADNDVLGDEVAAIANNSVYNKEQKSAIINYARALQKQRGYNLFGDVKQKRGQWDSLYDEGYEAEGDNMGVVVSQLAEARAKVGEVFAIAEDGKLNDPIAYMAKYGGKQGRKLADAIEHDEDLSNEEKAMLLDYAKAEYRYNAMMEGIEDRVDSQLEEDAKAFDDITNKDTGTVMKVLVKGKDGVQFYAKSGNIIYDNTTRAIDGAKTQIANGSPMVVLYDPQARKSIAVSVYDLEMVVENVNADRLKVSMFESRRDALMAAEMQLVDDYATEARASILSRRTEEQKAVEAEGQDSNSLTEASEAPKANDNETASLEEVAPKAEGAEKQKAVEKEKEVAPIESRGGKRVDIEDVIAVYEFGKSDAVAARKQPEAYADIITDLEVDRQNAIAWSEGMQGAEQPDNWEYWKEREGLSEPVEGENGEKGLNGENGNAPSLLDAVKVLYTKGKEVASKLFSMKFFDVAKTPKFMQELGLRGERFTIKYGVISRHIGKDSSHTLTERDWEQLPQALQNPFAISKLTDKKDSYRIYTTLQTESGEFIVVGADVKNAGRDIEINAISTVFGRRNNANLPKNEEVIYKSKEITPEQSSLLERPNFAQYPTEQELSADKGSKKVVDVQEYVAKWNAKTGEKVQVANSVEEVANAEARAAIEQGVKVKGWYDTRTGEVVVYAPNVKSAEDLVLTIVHENVSHKGLRDTLGEDIYNKMCDKTWEMMDEATRAKYESYAGVNSIKDETKRHRAAADEYIASIAEKVEKEQKLTESERSIWSEVLKAIKEFIVKLYGDVKLTEQDIASIIRVSYDRMRARGDIEANSGAEAKATENAPVVEAPKAEKKVRKPSAKKVEVKAEEHKILEEQNTPKVAKAPKAKGVKKKAGEDIAKVEEAMKAEKAKRELKTKKDIETRLTEIREEYEADKEGRDIQAQADAMVELYGGYANAPKDVKAKIDAQVAKLSERRQELAAEERELEKKLATLAKEQTSTTLDTRTEGQKEDGGYSDNSANSGAVEPYIKTDAELTEAEQKGIEYEINRLADGFGLKPSQLRGVEVKHNADNTAIMVATEWSEGASTARVVELIADNGTSQPDRIWQAYVDGKPASKLMVDEDVNAKDMEELFDERGLLREPTIEDFLKRRGIEFSIADRDKAIGEARFSVESLVGDEKIFEGMRKLEEGETSHVERVFTENKNFEFTTKNRIESYDDVAYIFKELENEAVENTFVALVKDGKPTVIHLGMGTSTASMVDFISANVAVRRINPDKIYFVHNHPSGALKASQQDMNILDAMKNAFGEDVVQDGIIINTFSGKYGTFGAYGDIDSSDIPRDQEEFPIKVHSFSKSVYDRGYKPTPAKSSTDIAAFITSQRLGERPKIGMIVANNQLQIIGNIFLPYSEFTEENADAIANDIAYYTSVMGGNAAFLFGNAKLSNIEGKGLRNKVEYRANKQIRLLDYIEVDGGRHKSANDDGVRFRFSESEEEFRATQKEAVEKKGIVMPNLATTEFEIVHIPRHNFTGTGKQAIKKAEKWAKENLDSQYTYRKGTKDEFVYSIDKDSIGKFLSESSTKKSANLGVHLAVLKKLPDVINASIEAEIHADYKKNDNSRLDENGINDEDLLIHRMYGAVEIDGVIYRAKTTIKERLNKSNNVYDYKVTDIDLVISGSASSDALTKPMSVDGANLLHEVEKSYDKGKYLLGESVKNVKSSEEEDDYSGEGGVRFRFIGEQGAKSMDEKEGTTARMDNLAVAKKMLDEYSYKEVKMATGWEQGMDGKWRYETPDFEKFDINGNLKFVQRHPDYARYRELVKKNHKAMLLNQDPLTEAEQAELDKLKVKWAGAFGKMDNVDTLDAYVQDDDLFNAYPELKSIRVKLTDELPKGTRGRFVRREADDILILDPEEIQGTIYLNSRYPLREVESTLIHEIQHAIQHIEGFAKGGNSEMINEEEQRKYEGAVEFTKERIENHRQLIHEYMEQQGEISDKMNDWYNRHGDEAEFDAEMRALDEKWDAIDKKIDGIQKRIREDERWLEDNWKQDFRLGYDGYRALAGEVEARNVQKRRGMTAEERRNSLAEDTEDVKRGQQIVVGAKDSDYSESLAEEQKGGVRFNIDAEDEYAPVWNEGESFAEANDRIRRKKTVLDIQLKQMERKRALGKSYDADKLEQLRAELEEVKAQIRYLEVGAPKPELAEGESETDASYVAKMNAWHDAMAEWNSKKYGEDAMLDNLLREASGAKADEDVTDEQFKQGLKDEEEKANLSVKEMKGLVKEQIRERRRGIEVSNWQDEMTIYDIKTRTTEEQRKLIPHILEGTYNDPQHRKDKRYADYLAQTGKTDVSGAEWSERKELLNDPSNVENTAITKNQHGLKESDIVEYAVDSDAEILVTGDNLNALIRFPNGDIYTLRKYGVQYLLYIHPEAKQNTITAEDAELLGMFLRGEAQQYVPQGLREYVEKKEYDEGNTLEVVNEIREWYAEAWSQLEAEGMVYKKEAIEDYVTHIWDLKKSSPTAVTTMQKFLAATAPKALKDINNYVATNTPYVKERAIGSIRDGEAFGLVPKYEDITDIMRDYGHRMNEARENRRLVNFVKGLRVNGMEAIREESGRSGGLYIPIKNEALRGYEVHRDVKPVLDVIFGEYHTTDNLFLQKIGHVYDAWGGLLKKINLSLSFFHHGALTETAIAMTNPLYAGKTIFKNILWDAAFKGDVIKWVKTMGDNSETPAYNDVELTKDAVSHFVQLGATSDYSTKEVQAITAKFAEWAEGKVGAEELATVLDFWNKGMDKFLWDYLHDGLKIYGYKKLSTEIRAKAEKEGWDEETLNRALDEAGQLINDTYGGQHWDLLGVSPNALKWARRAFLSPDWTLSTLRQALAPFGFGQMYDDEKFWKKWFKNDPVASVRKRYGRAFWVTAALFFGGIMNVLNAYYRMKDEDEEKKKAEEIRKTRPEYKSPYELAYPDGMRWWDYTMLGNTQGHETHLFGGRYKDGKEQYVRWGKQFRELPELFFGRDGLSFPQPMIDKITGKLNPMINLMSNLSSGYSLNGFQNDFMRDTRGWDREWARLQVLVAAHLPYSIPTDGEKEFKMIDLVMPSTKGFSNWKGIDRFKTAILAGDMDFCDKVYDACVKNGLHADELLDVAIKQIEVDAKRAMVEGVEDLSDAVAQHDKETNPVRKQLLANYIKKQMSAQDYEEITKEEMREKAYLAINGGVSDKNIKLYDKLCNSNDVIEDWRITKGKAGLKKYVDDLKALKEETDDTELIAKYAADNAKYLNQYKQLDKVQGVITSLKKRLGEGKDAEVMAKIREVRKKAFTAKGQEYGKKKKAKAKKEKPAKPIAEYGKELSWSESEE